MTNPKVIIQNPTSPPARPDDLVGRERYSLAGNIQHPRLNDSVGQATSNFQHPTSNIQHPRLNDTVGQATSNLQLYYAYLH